MDYFLIFNSLFSSIMSNLANTAALAFQTDLPETVSRPTDKQKVHIYELYQTTVEVDGYQNHNNRQEQAFLRCRIGYGEKVKIGQSYEEEWVPMRISKAEENYG